MTRAPWISLATWSGVAVGAGLGLHTADWVALLIAVLVTITGWLDGRAAVKRR